MFKTIWMYSPIIITLALIIIVFAFQKGLKVCYKKKYLYFSFLLGVFSVLPFALVREFYQLSNTINEISFKQLILFSFIMAFTTEVPKFAALKYLWKRANPDSLTGSSVFLAIPLSLGFIVTVLINHLFHSGSFEENMLMAFVTISINIFSALIIGFFIGIENNVFGKGRHSLFGLIIAIMVHVINCISLYFKDINVIIIYNIGLAIICLLLLYSSQECTNDKDYDWKKIL